MNEAPGKLPRSMRIVNVLYVIGVVLPMSISGVGAIVVGLATGGAGLIAAGVVLAVMGALAYLWQIRSQEQGTGDAGHDV